MGRKDEKARPPEIPEKPIAGESGASPTLAQTLYSGAPVDAAALKQVEEEVGVEWALGDVKSIMFPIRQGLGG